MSQQDPYTTPESSLYGGEPTSTPAPAVPLTEILVGVFTEPGALFEKLRARSDWWPPMLLMLGMTLVMSLVWVLKADHGAATEMRFEVMAQAFGTQIPDQVITEAVDKAAQSRPIVGTLLGALFGPWVGAAIIGLLSWGLARLSQPLATEPASFRQGFTLAVVHQLVMLPAWVGTLLVMALKPVGAMSVMALNPFTVGFFVRPENPWARGLMVGVLDPLYLLSYAVLAIGMSRMLQAKTWAIVVALVLMAFFGVGGRLFGGMF